MSMSMLEHVPAWLPGSVTNLDSFNMRLATIG